MQGPIFFDADEQTLPKPKELGAADMVWVTVYNEVVYGILKDSVGRCAAGVLFGEVGAEVYVGVVNDAHRMIAGQRAVDELKISKAQRIGRPRIARMGRWIARVQQVLLVSAGA
jgi:hypothetical protein